MHSNRVINITDRCAPLGDGGRKIGELRVHELSGRGYSQLLVSGGPMRGSILYQVSFSRP